MAEAKTEQEPSIEEILESIRQIISDDQPADAGGGNLKGPPPEAPIKAAVVPPPPSQAPIKAAAPPPPPPPPSPARAAVLDLTEAVEQPAPDIEMADVAQDTGGGLLSQSTEAYAQQALARLMGSMPIERDIPDRMPVHGNVTLEDITRELLRPMLKDWLDRNLPTLVERLVQKEIEKITRRVLGG